MNYFKSILYFLLSLGIYSCDNAATSPYPPITFNEITPMPGTGRASAVAFVINGKGYVALGRSAAQSGVLKDCWQYDPNKSDSCWKRKADFPGIGRVKATAAVVNGKAYVGLGFDISIGVYNYDAYLKDFWMYDPQTDSWTQKANFPSNYTDACGSFVVNNTIYVTSGMDGASFGNEVWKYDPAQGELGTWIKLTNFSGQARAGGIAGTNNNHIYFGTGYRTFMEKDWWEYFPVTDSWIQRKSMPDSGRVNSISISVSDRIFVSTGRYFAGNLTGGHVKSDIIEYDTERNVWYERGNIKASGRENAIAFTLNGKGYIGFGENDTEILNDLWSFEP
ncbi:MAG: hypothetical protein Q7U47_07085 [Paludibacter sp.]|nr:hypothetical protein [Paludibacter sp.]